MQVEETERTANYRFWFDVSEPGAAKYASQMGGYALFFALLYLVIDLRRWFGVWSLIPGYLAVSALMGGLRRLDLWAGMVVGILAMLLSLWQVAFAIRYGTVLAVITIIATLIPIAVLWASGLPMAVWATWVHRNLNPEDRWDLVGLPYVAAEMPAWKRWILVWCGAVRPR